MRMQLVCSRWRCAVVVSTALSAAGYLITINPQFNWSALTASQTNAGDFFTPALQHILLPTSDGLITEPIPIQVKKGITTLGGSPLTSELELWQWYARTQAYDSATALRLPYLTVDLEITKYTFSNGSKPIIKAIASVSAGMLAHSDAVSAASPAQTALQLRC